VTKGTVTVSVLTVIQYRVCNNPGFHEHLNIS